MTMEKITGELWANISASYQLGVFLDDVAAENKVLASGVSFLTVQPFFENCYNNQKIQNKDGYTYGHNSVPQPPPQKFDGANEIQQPAQQLLVVRFATTNPPNQRTNEGLTKQPT